MAGERGSTLFEVLTALMLTVLTAGALVGMVTGSARTVGQVGADDPLVSVAVDALSRDLRAAPTVAVVSTSGVVVTSIDLKTASATVRWSVLGGAVTRQVLPGGEIRTMVSGLDTTVPLAVSLLTSTGASVDHSNSTKVKDCTRRVRFVLTGADGEVLHDRSVSLRVFVAEPASC